MANIFALNVSLAFAVLTSVFLIVREITSRIAPALLAVALLATLPLFGQYATGGSMEVLNLAMISVTMLGAIWFLTEPSTDRLSFLLLTSVLLSQTRYESVLFVAPVAVVVILAWRRTGRVFLSWPAVITPLLLVPYAWHDRFVLTNPQLWQLREGEETRFALSYVYGNLEGAWNFFSSISPLQPNSICLVILGVAGIVWAILSFGRMRREGLEYASIFNSASAVIALFGLTIAGNLALLMFYYWSRLDAPVATRFALPLLLILSVVAGWFIRSLDARRIPAMRVAVAALALWLIVIASPAYAHRFYTLSNLVLHELDWELDEISRRQGPLLLITTKANLPFLLKQIPALNTNIVRFRVPQIAWHMREGTFREVLVSQVIRPSSADGDPVVEPDDVLPDGFDLETIAQKRFGSRWIRISRVKSIRFDDVTTSEVPSN